MIRMATINDLNPLAELFDLYRIFYKQKSNLDAAKLFLFDKFEHNESIIFVAEIGDGKVFAGFTQIYPSFSSISMKRALILNDLFVREEYRRQGIAQALLSHTENYARQIGAKGLALSTAFDNFQAQRLYERNNYHKDVDYFHYFLTL